MKKQLLITIVLSTALLHSCGVKKELDNPFYAFNTCMSMPNAPESYNEKIQVIKNLGYDGLGSGSNIYFEIKKAIDEEDFLIPEIYAGFDVDSTETQYGTAHYESNMKDIIKDLKGKQTIISLTLISKSKRQAGDEYDVYVAEQLGELADYASQYGVRLAIYPHAFVYCQRIEHAIKLVKMVDRSNFGMIINLCHLLKVEGEEGYEEKIRKAIPYLMMVSINGAEQGDTQEMDFRGQLIQPLGEGSFDTYKFIKTLKDSGYDGIIGLQCYSIKQDFEVALTKSMNTWKSYQERYSKEK